MELGKRIRECRLIRNMTQEELGLALGYTEKNAATRVTQYETGYRTPKEDTLIKIAEVLSVSLYNFIQPAGKDYIEAAINLMEYLFWKDDQFLNFVKLTPMTACNDGTETPTEKYHINYDTDKTYMNLRFGGPLVNDCLMEWYNKIQEVKAKKLTDKEYREWKYTWPESSKYRSELLREDY